MKKVLLALAALSTLSISGLAHAEMKAPGSFVPTLCSRTDRSGEAQADIVAISGVCMGKIVGSSERALQISVNDGTKQVYLIKLAGKLGGMGVSRSEFSGVAQDGSEQTVTGKIEMTSGITTTHRIAVETSGNLNFVGDLQMVFTTL